MSLALLLLPTQIWTREEFEWPWDQCLGLPLMQVVDKWGARAYPPQTIVKDSGKCFVGTTGLRF